MSRGFFFKWKSANRKFWNLKRRLELCDVTSIVNLDLERLFSIYTSILHPCISSAIERFITLQNLPTRLPGAENEWNQTTVDIWYAYQAMIYTCYELYSAILWNINIFISQLSIIISYICYVILLVPSATKCLKITAVGNITKPV